MLRVIYRCVLRLHPPYFRQRFAEEMLSIFDETPGGLASFLLVSDAVISLIRQWALRSEFWEGKSAETWTHCASESGPVLLSFEGTPLGAGPFCNGVVLSVAMFCMFWIAIIYGRDSAMPAPLRGATSQVDARAVPDQGSTAPVADHAARGISSLPTPMPSAIALPHPSGEYGVGRVRYDWVDNSRPETFANDANSRREIVVYVWYPTQKGQTQNSAADYWPHADEIAKSLPSVDFAQLWGSAWPRVVASRVLTDTHEQAPIAPGGGRFPLLLFSPGFGVPSTGYTSLIQELVSRGYIVASIEPTYEVAAVAFPDGRVVPYMSPGPPGPKPASSGETWDQFLNRIRAFDETGVDRWAADVRFVIDRVTAIDTSTKNTPFIGRLDLSNIGAWGHSFGGLAATRACQIDARVRACINGDGAGPDGPIFPYKDTELPRQPFMWIQSAPTPPATNAVLALYGMTRQGWEKNRQARLATMEQAFRAMPGGVYHLTFNTPGIDHLSFQDLRLLNAKNREAYDKALHDLEPIETYTAAFFDKYLKHENAALLDNPKTSSDGITLLKYGKAR